jgi:quercetin dioxygenase-like cupin family protein
LEVKNTKGNRCLAVRFEESKLEKVTEPEEMKGLAVQIFYDERTPTKNVFFGIGFFEPGGQCGWHTHEVEEVEYVISGGPGEAQFEDRTEVLEKGVAIYEPIGVPHNFVNTGKERLCCVYMFPESDPYKRRNIPVPDPRKK